MHCIALPVKAAPCRASLAKDVDLSKLKAFSADCSASMACTVVSWATGITLLLLSTMAAYLRGLHPEVSSQLVV